jgi:hypothetical protein
MKNEAARKTKPTQKPNKRATKTARRSSSELACSEWLDAHRPVSTDASNFTRQWMRENYANLKQQDRDGYYARSGLLYDFLTDYLFYCWNTFPQSAASSGAHELRPESRKD